MAEIGQLPLPRRRQFPNAPCYVCRSCSAIVGYAEHLVSYALDIIPDCFLLTYVQPGNVFVDLRSFERGVYHLCTLYCGNCYRLIGWKIPDHYQGSSQKEDLSFLRVAFISGILSDYRIQYGAHQLFVDGQN